MALGIHDALDVTVTPIIPTPFTSLYQRSWLLQDLGRRRYHITNIDEADFSFTLDAIISSLHLFDRFMPWRTRCTVQMSSILSPACVIVITLFFAGQIVSVFPYTLSAVASFP